MLTLALLRSRSRPCGGGLGWGKAAYAGARRFRLRRSFGGWDGRQVGNPRVAPPPQPFPASGRGSERPTLVARSDWFHGSDRL